jgi:dihydrofolate reductase
MYKIKAIMAMDKNGTVGNGLELPWKDDPSVSWDMANFRKMTYNHIVFMGYHTYDSLKKPLKNRLNIVCGRVKPEDEFYSLKDKKMVPNNLTYYENSLNESEEVQAYYKDVRNAEKIQDPEDLRNFLDIYWGLREHEENVNTNNANIDSLKVNLTESRISSLYSFIPVKDTDKRFVFIKSFDDLIGGNSLDQLKYTLQAIQDQVKVCDEMELTEADVKKIKSFDFNEIFIIGGAKTYKSLINFIDEFYVTEFNKEYPGDIKFSKSLLEENFPNKEVIEEHDNGRIIKYFK